MKIYRIVSDVDNFQWIMPKREGDLFEKLSFDCVSKRNDWQPIDMYVFNPKKKKGNFYSLGGLGILVFDEKVLDAMLTIFEMAGEILPVKIENVSLYTLNVLECVNAINEKESKWDYYNNGMRGRILKYMFYEKRLTESSIFKIPETSKGDVLTYSGLKDEDDEFYSLYLKHGFKGLIFDEIYDSGESNRG
jgi:hypothetical protein